MRTIYILENEVTYLKNEIQRLQQTTTAKSPFNLDRFASNDKKILYYTGFQTYELLMTVFKWILPSGDIKNVKIYNALPETQCKSYLSKLIARDQFFLTLMRLRRRLCIKTLADMFSISMALVDNIFLSWVNL